MVSIIAFVQLTYFSAVLRKAPQTAVIPLKQRVAYACAFNYNVIIGAPFKLSSEKAHEVPQKRQET
jgi:hypothetical protein